MTQYTPPDLHPREWSPWSQVSTQIVGESGADLIRPASTEDTTKIKFVLVRTPDACAAVANRFHGGVPHLQTTATHAAGLLSNSVWRSLNENLAYELVPDLMPPRPEAQVSQMGQLKAEPVKPDGRIARLLAAAEKRKQAEAELLRDASRSDRLLSKLIGLARAEVRAIRRRLESEGSIAKIDPDKRVGIERPKRYKRQAERVAEIAKQTAKWRRKP